MEATPYVYSFTAEQHVTLIATLCLAAQMYADPACVIDTLRVVSPAAANSFERTIREREEAA